MMERRVFIKTLIGGVLFCTGIAKIAANSVRKIISASRGTIRYPGKIKLLNEREIEKQGTWKG